MAPADIQTQVASITPTSNWTCPGCNARADVLAGQPGNVTSSAEIITPGQYPGGGATIQDNTLGTLSADGTPTTFGDITGYNVAGVTGVTGTYGAQGSGGGGIGSDYAANASTGAAAYADPSMYQQLPPAVVEAGDVQSAGAQKAAGTVAAGETGAAGVVSGTLASAVASAETFLGKAFVVVALVVLGAILVAFGLGLFNKKMVPI
jgi:hypothetical protein